MPTPEIKPKHKYTTDDLFVELLGPLLYRELLYQGVKNPDAAYNYMMRQLAHESDHGRSRLAKELHNYGGVGYNKNTGKYYSYKNEADFLHDYVRMMNSKYRQPLNSKSLRDYVFGMKGIGYFEADPEEYYSSMAGMKSLEKAMQAHRLNNPSLYAIEDGYQPKQIIHVPDNTRVAANKSQPHIAPKLQVDLLANNQLDMWDMWDKWAVSVGKKPLIKNTLASLPDIGDMIADNKHKYFADMLGLSSVYDTGNLNYEFAPFMISARNGKLPRFEGGYAPVANIPEVVVTPDPNLRKQVNETWPDKEVRELVLKEIGTYKKTAEREYYYGDRYHSPEFYGDASKTAGGISYIWEGGRGLPANYEIQRAMNLVKQAGYPDVYVFRDKGGVDNTTNRSFYKWRLVRGMDEPGIHISTADSTDPYFSELAHAYAEYNNLDRDAKWVKHDPNDYNVYMDPTNGEYQAHEIIQPSLYEYLRAPKEFDIDYMNRSIKRLIKQKIKEHKNGKLPKLKPRRR